MSYSRIRGVVDLTRPANVISAGILTGTGGLVTTGPTEITMGPVLAALFATMFAVGGGNAINDYFDREIDAITNPERPIPRGSVQPTDAIVLSCVLLVAALTCVSIVPRIAQSIAVLNALILVTYTSVFKGQPGVGNVVVGYLIGSALWFGAAAAAEPFEPTTIVLACLAGFATVARELVKDVEDISGDRAEGLRTLPIVIGVRPTLVLATGCVLLGLLMSPIPVLLDSFGVVYLSGVTLANGVLVWAMVGSQDNPTASQRWLKYGMLLALGAFFLGSIV